MGTLGNIVRAIKDRWEPIVWLVGTVVVPIGGGLIYMYKAADEKIVQFQSNITQNVAGQLEKQLKAFQDSNNNLFEQVKHKIVDELDSTYYFTKSYALEDDPSVDQYALSQFFYAADTDLVKIFIWTAGRVKAEMEINVNGGKKMKLKDFGQRGQRAWTNVDITEYVKNSPTLNDEQYQGISDNVYNISIVPLPKKSAEESIAKDASTAKRNKTTAAPTGLAPRERYLERVRDFSILMGIPESARA